jgi:hypothetical protein
MFHPIAVSLLDHVDLASPMEATGYMAVVVLWLAGVALFVLHKVRASR